MTAITLHINVKETSYEVPTEWRMLGAKGKAEHVIKLCAQNNITPERVLEVGAGDGAILRCLAENRFCDHLHALEISQSGVDVILKQGIPGLISCRTFDGYNLPFEDKYFDVVVLSHVLEHVEYERALLREISRVSKYQVIEIPMDCNALKDEVYHLLGPSYGHINAHTPDSLRFLLATENFSVIDELLGQYSLELQEYDYFVNNSHDRTPKAVEQFRNTYRQSEAQFNSLPRAMQEARSSYYAVLTQEEDAETRLARALKGAKRSVASGQVQAARLIFDHYVPKALVPERALEVARSVSDANPHIALEFVDRALAVDGRNAAALDLKVKIARNMTVKPLPARLVTPQNRTLVRRVKDLIKSRFPRFAHILRELRK